MHSIDELLSLGHVRCRSPEATRRKFRTFVEGGLNELLVISDFDSTLSRSHDGEGKPCWNSYTVFEEKNSAFNLGQKCADLLKPENSAKLTIEEKISLMEEWYDEEHDFIVKARISKDDIVSDLRNGSLFLRDGCADFLRNLELNDVPLVVFSGGIDVVIQLAFETQLKRPMPSNVHIISNGIEFDSEILRMLTPTRHLGIVCAFRDPIVHVFNKNSSSAAHMEPKFYTRVADCTNVLLLGDVVTDADMHVHRNARDADRELKIGFLNKNAHTERALIDKLLPHYLDAFDLVVIDDQTMRVPSAVIGLLSHESAALLARKSNHVE